MPDKDSIDVLISVSAAEKVPTGEYANVDIGPITGTMTIPIEYGENFVEDFKEKTQVLQQTVEEVVAEERLSVLAALKA